MRIVLSFVLGAAALVHSAAAHADAARADAARTKQGRLLNPAVLCVPSEEQVTHPPPADPASSMFAPVMVKELGLLPFSCLVRLPPLFNGASFELTPRFALARSPRRWGAEFEMRF